MRPLFFTPQRQQGQRTGSTNTRHQYDFLCHNFPRLPWNSGSHQWWCAGNLKDMTLVCQQCPVSLGLLCLCCRCVFTGGGCRLRWNRMTGVRWSKQDSQGLRDLMVAEYLGKVNWDVRIGFLMQAVKTNTNLKKKKKKVRCSRYTVGTWWKVW